MIKRLVFCLIPPLFAHGLSTSAENPCWRKNLAYRSDPASGNRSQFSDDLGWWYNECTTLPDGYLDSRIIPRSRSFSPIDNADVIEIQTAFLHGELRLCRDPGGSVVIRATSPVWAVICHASVDSRVVVIAGYIGGASGAGPDNPCPAASVTTQEITMQSRKSFGKVVVAPSVVLLPQRSRTFDFSCTKSFAINYRSYRDVVFVVVFRV